MKETYPQRYTISLSQKNLMKVILFIIDTKYYPTTIFKIGDDTLTFERIKKGIEDILNHGTYNDVERETLVEIRKQMYSDIQEVYKNSKISIYIDRI